MTTNLEQFCTNIYEETAKRFANSADISICPKLAEIDQDFGYKILYGPPAPNGERPKVLFVGYQPGGGREGFRIEEHSTWSQVCAFATDDYRLGNRLKKIFGVDFLKKTTALNVIFFRSPDVKQWRKVPKELRKELEQYSKGKAEELIKAINPHLIIAIGLETFEILIKKKGDIVLKNRVQRLAVEGSFAGINMIGVTHLSGSRIPKADLSKLTQYLQNKTNHLI